MNIADCEKSYFLTVVLGAHDLRKKNENSVRFTVESYHQHPNYTNKSFHNDILLLKVTNSEGSDIEADSVCSIAGWGLLETNGKRSDHLMETDVKVMNNMECERGPLVCGDTAVGVTSFGDPDLCNSQNLPEVYTKISAYIPWIKKITGNVN
uniref:Peptidase S1 domain-containing protein n=1 Tax=Cyprinus carpio TaxID=7962 RepID=A0A8C2FT79_CYPCA